MEKYKKSKLEALDKFVKGLNYSIIPDKEVRNTFVRLIPQTARRLKEIEEDKKSLFEKFIEVIPQEKRIAYDEANRERMDAYKKYEESRSEEDRADFEAKQSALVSEYADILSAVDQFNQAVNEVLADDTDLSVDGIEIDRFLDAMEGQEFSVTADTFEMLNPIVRFSEPDMT